MYPSLLEVQSLLPTMEAAPIPMMTRDSAAVVTKWNTAMERLLGWRAEEMLGHEFHFQEVAAGANADGQIPAEPFGLVRHRHKDGQLLDLHIWTVNLLDEHKRPQGSMSVLLDVTQQVRSEKRLAAQNRVLKIMSEEGFPQESHGSILEAICQELSFDYGAFWRVQSGEFIRRTLWLNPELRAKDCTQDVPGCIPGLQTVLDLCERRQPIDLNLQQDLHCCQCHNHCRFVIRSAMAIPILMNGQFWGALEFCSSEPRGSDSETLACLHSIGSQIGNCVERNGAQQRLRDNEKLYKSIFSGAGIGITGASLDGRLEQMNGAYLAMLGYTEEELRGRTFQKLTHPDDLKLELPIIDEINRGERNQYTIEKRYIKKDGSTLWVRVTVSVVTHEPKFFIAMVENIEDQRRAREQLRQSEQHFRLMVDAENSRTILAAGGARSPAGFRGRKRRGGASRSRHTARPPDS